MTAQRFSAPFIEPALSPIRVLLEYAKRPGTISFAGGHPDVSLFNVNGLRAASERVNSQLASCLQYGETAGQPSLLEALANVSSTRGIKADPHREVVVTNGSQQALTLLAQVMLAEGDEVVVESPCFPSTMQALRHRGAELIPVTCGPGGMDLDELETVLTTRKPKMICVVASFSNPAGSTLSANDRIRLLKLATKHKVLLVEDDPYSDLRYSGEQVAPIASFAEGDERDWVVYLSSLSKTVAPSLRIGWMVANPELRRRCVVAKQGDDLSTSPWNQEIAAEYLKAGEFERHLPFLLETYGARCKAMCDTLIGLSGGRINFVTPQGGMFVWGSLASGQNADNLLESAISNEVVFVPGAAFYPAEGTADRSTFRLSFASVGSEMIRSGVGRLVRALDQLRPEE